MEKKGNRPMTQAEEVRELRIWLREESKDTQQMVRDLHKKIDDCNKENQKEHKELADRISSIHTVGAVNKAQIVGIVSIVSIIVSAIAVTALAQFGG